LQRQSVGDSATSNRVGRSVFFFFWRRFLNVISEQLNRALRSMSEPPADVPMEVLISQIAKSIVAEEKLVVLEAKSREASAGKPVQERARRDMRLPT
jgi:hypothetical protein